MAQQFFLTMFFSTVVSLRLIWPIEECVSEIWANRGKRRECLLFIEFAFIFFFYLKEDLSNWIIFGRHQTQSHEQIFAAQIWKVNSLSNKPHSGQQSTMHGSYFHHLFLVCIWLSVKAPQLGCDAVSINGQEDRAAANQCWEKCSLAANVSRSAAKVLEVSYSFRGKRMS